MLIKLVPTWLRLSLYLHRVLYVSPPFSLPQTSLRFYLSILSPSRSVIFLHFKPEANRRCVGSLREAIAVTFRHFSGNRPFHFCDKFEILNCKSNNSVIFSPASTVTSIPHRHHSCYFLIPVTAYYFNLSISLFLSSHIHYLILYNIVFSPSSSLSSLLSSLLSSTFSISQHFYSSFHLYTL